MSKKKTGDELTADLEMEAAKAKGAEYVRKLVLERSGARGSAEQFRKEQTGGQQPADDPGQVGAFPIPLDSDLTPRSIEKEQGFRENEAKQEKGGPVRGDQPLGPYATAKDSPAFRRADGSRHEKE